MNKQTDPLSWIQNWFYNNCNGDWEHNQNIIIENLDNPGWSLTIKLEGTLLEKKPFKTVDIEKDKNNWHYCRVHQGKFEGAGGPLNLGDLLAIFKQWAESCESKINSN